LEIGWRARLCLGSVSGDRLDTATACHARVESLLPPLDFIKLEHQLFKIVIDSNFSRLRYPDVQEGEFLHLAFGRELIMCLVDRV
jgi:hypothetical protein